MKNTRQWSWFERTEFLVATVIYLGCILTLLSEGPSPDNQGLLTDFTSPFIQELAEFSMLYLGFLLLNFLFLPDFVAGIRRKASIAITIFILGLATALFKDIRIPAIALGSFTIYSVIRYALIFVAKKSADVQARYSFVAPGVLVAMAVWAISLIFFIAAEADLTVVAAWGALIPLAIVLYTWSFFKLLPRLAEKKKKVLAAFLLRVTALLIVIAIPTGLLLLAITNNEDVISIVLLNFIFQLFITVPFSWYMYKKHKKDSEEIISLQKELGQSHANIDFLRSQINPHFLFNALNTLYGTALMEKAERTGTGIQKLGDMMRFMLEENMQEKISINREIDYLQNYISLQKLRTDVNPDIQIDVSIPDEVFRGSIPPMLLIPFVENAFKHGISFRQPSYIRITLAITEYLMDLKVTNSNPSKNHDDPERRNNGVGLLNVKERLKLQYPGRHELVIRESEKEFFIHLALQLN